ncbi:hypothetical protein GGS24DRAFT_509411 [Hypoxylon argillaceum]|nr:hypothetical protein GGS24DRAFT_509411 [Hypoxylon argillaceum]
MASQDSNLYDATKLASDVLTSLISLMGGDASSLDQETIKSLRDVLEGYLKEYNSKYRDLNAAYNRIKEEVDGTKASYAKQIEDLQKSIEDEKNNTAQEVEYATRALRKDRDDTARDADHEREEMEKERQGLATRRQEAKNDVEQAKKEVQDALEDRKAAIAHLEEVQTEASKLQETINGLEKTKRDNQEEIAGWKGEVEKITKLKEKAGKDLLNFQSELKPIKEENRKLTKELAELKLELRMAKKNIKKQESKIQELKAKLTNTEDQLESFAKDSAFRKPSPEGPTAADELRGKERSDTGSSELGSPKSARSIVSRKTLSQSSDGLDKEKEKNLQLQETIESQEQTINEKSQQLEDCKTERITLQAAQANYDKALQDLEGQLIKKEKGEIKIKELERKIKALEAEASNHKRDDTSQKDHIQRLEKQLQAAKDRIAALEKLEREQQTNIADQQAKIAELRRMPDTANAQVQATLSDRDQEDKNNQIKSLSEELEQGQKRIESLEDEVKYHQGEASQLQENYNATNAELEKLKNAPPPTAGLEEAEQELTKVRGELDQSTKELARSKEDLREANKNTNIHLTSLQELGPEQDQLRLRNSLLQVHLEQKQEVQDALLKELAAADSVRERLRRAVQSTLQPNVDRDTLSDTLNQQVIDLANSRQEIFKLQGRLIIMAELAARDYTNITNEEFAIEGHASTPASLEPYVSDARQFVRSMQGLYDRFTERLREAEKQLSKVKSQLEAQAEAGDAAAEEAAEALQEKIDELKDKNQELEILLKECQENQKDAEEPDADPSDVIAAIRSAAKAFLGIAGPTIADIDLFLVDLIRLQKLVPGAKSFGENADKALAAANTELTDCGTKLKDANKKLEDSEKQLEESDRKLKDAERKRQEAAKKSQDDDAERRRLAAEVKRLEAEVQRLAAELQVLRAASAEQASLLTAAGTQTERASAVLDEQIGLVSGFDANLREIQRELEAMGRSGASEGRMAAQISRVLGIARREIEKFKLLKETLTAQRDLLQDDLRLNAEVQRRARRRARERAEATKVAAEAATATATAEADAATAAAAAADAPAAAPAAGDAAGAGVVREVAGPSFFRSTHDLFFRVLQYNLVGGALVGLFSMMVVVTIAEGRQYAEWTYANEHTRALWMDTNSRTTVCLGAPNFNYFWHTLGLLLSGRWEFS